jgi:uncharacterized membrane protein YeaQ/YmgE (transglycosylase-associated protein family)
VTLVVIIVVALVVLVLLGGAISATSGFLGLVLHLVMAGVIGVLADRAVPGRLPWGWIGAVVAGLLGSWLGVLLIGRVGPSLFGVPLLPALVGALILAVVAALVSPFTSRLKRRGF